jgi:formylglycine-generating enzyme required for sulfatase activity
MGESWIWPILVIQSRSIYGMGDNLPVNHVSWCDIVGAEGAPEQCLGYTNSFLKKLNENYGGSNPYKGDGTDVYRLPTNKEWEYAIRAKTSSRYACGEYVAGENGCPGSMGWFIENNGPQHTPEYGLKPVGTKQPNAWGLYDMHGNVWEWLHKAPESTENPTRTGGSWKDYRDALDSVVRGFTLSPKSQSNNIGFRLVHFP